MTKEGRSYPSFGKNGCHVSGSRFVYKENRYEKEKITRDVLDVHHG